MITKRPFVRVLITALCLFSANTALSAEGDWHFGLGTGILALNLEGKTGFTTAQGSAKTKIDLNADQLNDLLESAIGIGGFAAHGNFKILFAYSAIELEGGVAGSFLGVPPVGGGTISASLNLEVTRADVAVSYLMAKSGKHAWSALFGLRYMEHDYDINFSLGGMAARRKIKEDWTDVVLGVTHAYPISDKVAWTSRVDYGLGGSEGTFFANTGINWRINDRFSTSLFAQITAVDFENKRAPHPQWYLYDVDEFGFGLNVLVTW